MELDFLMILFCLNCLERLFLIELRLLVLFEGLVVLLVILIVGLWGGERYWVSLE